MTDDLENPGQWRDTVETRLSTLETTVEEQARLRAAMDNDIGDLKAGLGAQLRVINAIRETQSDHTTQIRELREGVSELREGVSELREELGAVKGTLQTVHAGVDVINGKLDRLIGDDPTVTS